MIFQNKSSQATNDHLDLSRVKALCFDVDGTLSDTDDQFVENLVRKLTPVRFLFPENDTRPFARRVVMATETPANLLYGIPDRLGIDGVLNRISNWIYQRGLGSTSTPFQLIPGVRQTLRRCKNAYPLAVVSARGKRSTMRFLSQFDLEGFFECVGTAQTTSHTKPYPDPILWAARQMGVEPESCLMIGDTTVDITAARRAGAQSVGVLCGFGEENELLKAGAQVVLETTSALPDLLFENPDSPGD